MFCVVDVPVHVYVYVYVHEYAYVYACFWDMARGRSIPVMAIRVLPEAHSGDNLIPEG